MSESHSQMDIQLFYAECTEILARVSGDLSGIESNPQSTQAIDSIYRDIHTIKGSSQLFQFDEISHVAHAMEASLEPVRRLNTPLNPVWIDSLLSNLDIIQQIIQRGNKTEISPDIHSNLINSSVCRLLEITTQNFNTDLLVSKDYLIDMEEQTTLGDKNIATDTIPNKNIHQSPQLQGTTQAPSSAKEDPKNNPQESSSTIRVQVSLLDRLMNLVGEMVLVRNQVLQYSHTHDDFVFLNLSQKLDLVTTELQEEVMKTRMQPICSILTLFNRVVRDLARDLHKQIELVILGAETELDKTLIEAIKDPLTHIIRNACDHGIEPPQERKALGKPPTGKICVTSQQESGQVVIEITDDGRGLDSKKILEKALGKTLISPEKAQNLSEREIYQLIFSPGFSTAQQVSAVSGRGVGMDVVKTNIEKIGGAVDLKSEKDQGTCIRLRIPLTLAIVPALIVRYRADRFAIPQVKLVELVRVDVSESNQKIEFLQGRPVFRLRGTLLPLVTLDELIDGANLETSQEPVTKRAEKSINLVVLTTDSGNFGLIVDEILDTTDIVVKPLAKFFKKLMIYSGATIMGDGSVSLILDIQGVAQRANLNHNKKKMTHHGMNIDDAQEGIAFESQEMLSFELEMDGTFLIPLCLVQRLEEFSRIQIETSGKQRIIQYRNTVLPLISLNDILSAQSGQHKQELKGEVSTQIPVVVIQKGNRLYGIEVKEIIDILIVDHEIEEPIKEIPGILGNVIIKAEVATVVDVLGVIDRATGNENLKRGQSADRKGTKARMNSTSGSIKILLVEDTVFFVKQIQKILTSQGYEVTHALHGEEALKILEDRPPHFFDLIISDIEMPKLNGFQLAEKVRASQSFSKMPMIALTTRNKESDVELGKKAGFNRYLEKLRADLLLEAVDQLYQETVLNA